MNLQELDPVLRSILDGLAPGVELSTRQLLEQIEARTDCDKHDRAIYDMLDKLAPKFQDSWHNGVPFKKYGRTMTPKIWHRPREKRCPHCNGVL